ncbi:MAG: diacylglycerol kinase family protein [Pirellulales bacterium]
MMNHWLNKFRFAFQGIASGVRGQSSFKVHVPATILVVILAVALNCSTVQWCILGLCVALVWIAELFNSSIELLARGLCSQQNADVGKALDVAAGAVLVASIFAAAVGGSIFFVQLWGS